MSLLWLLGQVGQEEKELQKEKEEKELQLEKELQEEKELQRKLQLGQGEQELQPKLQVGLSQETPELQPLLTRTTYRPGRAMRGLLASQLGARRLES